MPRRTRIHFPGAIYHVILRGNNRKKIFVIDRDYQKFLEFISDALEKFACKLHAYCLMPNHVHLLVEITNEPLALLMHNLSFRYCYWFNQTYDCIGHLFQGRYKALLVDNEAYMLELVRYINQNPVKANLVNNISEYQWSSAKKYVDFSDDPLITVDKIKSIFINNFAEKITLSEFMTLQTDYEFKPQMQLDENGKVIICDSIMIQNAKPLDSCEKVTYQLDKIIFSVCDIMRINTNGLTVQLKTRLFCQARALIYYFGQKYTNATLKELAELFKKSSSTVSSSINKLKVAIKHDSSIQKLMHRIETELNS